MIRHGSLFSGIGGFDLAAQWMGWENVFQVEWDKYCQKVLAKNFPKVKRYEDIKEFKGIPGTVDIISGGFPCQPFSHAGKRKGTADDRYLWPEMLRVIREVKPTFVVGENVAGLLSMEDGKTLERIFADLEDEGYEVESFIIPACGVGAWHRRSRIWILAYSIISGYNRTQFRDSKDNTDKNKASQNIRERHRGGIKVSRNSKDVSNTNKFNDDQPGFRTGKISQFKEAEISRVSGWNSEPNVGRVANGIPRRVDRLKGLGNAIVPQVAYEIFKAIDTIVQNE